MKELYRFHNKDEYRKIKQIVFSFSVIADAIKVVHAAIENEIAGYLTKVYNGQYKHVALQDTDECYIISLYTRAKSALLNRKVVARRSTKTKVNTLSEDTIKDFEKELYSPDEHMHYDDD